MIYRGGYHAQLLVMKRGMKKEMEARSATRHEHFVREGER
jgi:hypothetical protein